MAVNVAGYAKLAKMWERSREDALSFQRSYYRDKFANNPEFRLVDVYVDITGSKNISKRPEMLRLLKDCMSGKIDLICVQTRGYLAANMKEFCYLVRFLFDLERRIDVATEDDNNNINTILNKDDQRRELREAAGKYSNLNPADYAVWKNEILEAVKAQ